MSYPINISSVASCIPTSQGFLGFPVGSIINCELLKGKNYHAYAQDGEWERDSGSPS